MPGLAVKGPKHGQTPELHEHFSDLGRNHVGHKASKLLHDSLDEDLSESLTYTSSMASKSKLDASYH